MPINEITQSKELLLDKVLEKVKEFKATNSKNNFKVVDKLFETERDIPKSKNLVSDFRKNVEDTFKKFF